MNVARINEILVDCLGDINQDGQAEPGSECVDVWQVVALKPDKVREYEPEMTELLKAWPGESCGDPVPELGQEINYITAGKVLDGQHHAFLLFAYGKLLEWWDVLDPHSVLGMDKDDELAQQIARVGMITIFGYRP